MIRLALPILPACIAVLLVVFHVPIPSVMTGVTHTIASPLWGVRDTVRATVVATYSSLSSTEALVAENIALHNEISSMRRENFLFQITKRENERLRALLGRARAEDGMVSAVVLNDEAYSPYDSFVIDQGADNGVSEHMLVLSPEGGAIGSVYRALGRTSVITKFSAPTVETSILFSATTTLHATMRGYGDGTMVVRVPRDIDLHEGVEVLLPNYAGNPVGVIARIEVTPQDAYQTVYVRSPVNVHELRYVFVDTYHTWEATGADMYSSTTSTSNEEIDRLDAAE